MQVEAIEAGEGEEGGAGHRGQQVVVQGQPLQPGQTWVQEWSGNASRQHKMWYYNKCTVHVLVESVERPFKCFILTCSVILSQPPRQEDSVLLTWKQTTSTTTRELWVGVCAGDSVLFMGLCPCVSRLVLQKIPSEGS